MQLYSDLLCIAVHPKRFTVIWGGGVSPQPSPVCSIHLDDATAATVQRRQCAHTHQLQVERRESQSSGWGLLGGNDWPGSVEGIWPGHRGYTPTLSNVLVDVFFCLGLMFPPAGCFVSCFSPHLTPFLTVLRLHWFSFKQLSYCYRFWQVVWHLYLFFSIIWYISCLKKNQNTQPVLVYSHRKKKLCHLYINSELKPNII